MRDALATATFDLTDDYLDLSPRGEDDPPRDMIPGVDGAVAQVVRDVVVAATGIVHNARSSFHPKDRPALRLVAHVRVEAVPKDKEGD